MSLPQTVHLELLLTPDLGGFCLFSYAPRQPVLQNSWKDSLESTCATMVPFMLVMSLEEKNKQTKKKHHEEPINKRIYEATSPPGGTRDLSSAGQRLTSCTWCSSSLGRACVKRRRGNWWSRKGVWSLCAGRPSGLSLRAFYSLHRSPGVKKKTTTRHDFELSVEATHLLIAP